MMLGLGISPGFLSKTLSEADQNTIGLPPSDTTMHSEPLSAEEKEILISGGALGVSQTPRDELITRADLLLSLTRKCRALAQQSLDTEAVAKRLQVTIAEVYHSAQSSPPQLHAFELKPNKLFFPSWQFTNTATIPYLSRVLSIAESTNPLVLSHFMLLPNPDLENGDERCSPRDWLVLQNNPEPVMNLARFLTSD